jgi:hypothetical protein
MIKISTSSCDLLNPYLRKIKTSNHYIYLLLLLSTNNKFGIYVGYEYTYNSGMYFFLSIAKYFEEQILEFMYFNLDKINVGT